MAYASGASGMSTVIEASDVSHAISISPIDPHATTAASRSNRHTTPTLPALPTLPCCPLTLVPTTLPASLPPRTSWEIFPAPHSLSKAQPLTPPVCANCMWPAGTTTCCQEPGASTGQNFLYVSVSGLQMLNLPAPGARRVAADIQAYACVGERRLAGPNHIVAAHSNTVTVTSFHIPGRHAAQPQLEPTHACALHESATSVHPRRQPHTPMTAAVLFMPARIFTTLG